MVNWRRLRSFWEVLSEMKMLCEYRFVNESVCFPGNSIAMGNLLRFPLEISECFQGELGGLFDTQTTSAGERTVSPTSCQRVDVYIVSKSNLFWRERTSTKPPQAEA